MNYLQHITVEAFQEATADDQQVFFAFLRLLKEKENQEGSIALLLTSFHDDPRLVNWFEKRGVKPEEEYQQLLKLFGEERLKEGIIRV